MARRSRFEGTFRNTRELAVVVYRELLRTDALDVAASMGFYFLFSLMPLLIFASALLAFLPIPHLFDQMHQVLQTFIPDGSLLLKLEMILAGVVTHRRSGLLSFGLLAYLYTVTSAFASTIGALDVAYDVTPGRTWLRRRLRALLLAITGGLLSFVSLLVLMAGPLFLHLLAKLTPVPHAFAELWSLTRVVILFVTLILGVQLLYYLGPSRKQRFLPTFYGAVIAVVIWFFGSYGLEYYLSHFAHYDRTYGSLGLAMSLMAWFYLIALGILIGAEWNAEWDKQRQPQHHRSARKGVEDSLARASGHEKKTLPRSA